MGLKWNWKEIKVEVHCAKPYNNWKLFMGLKCNFEYRFIDRLETVDVDKNCIA